MTDPATPQTCWCDAPAEFVNEATDASPEHPCCGEHVKDGYRPLPPRPEGGTVSENTAADSLAHHFSLVMDNDYGSHLLVQELVEEARESETPRADLADALKDTAERLLDLENDENMLRLELLTTALGWIDWHAMADSYLQEH